MCPIAGVALVAVIMSALVIGCLVRKLMTGKYNRQTAAEDHRRADRLYDRARDPNLPAEQKEKFFNEAAENEKHARMAADEEVHGGEVGGRNLGLG